VDTASDSMSGMTSQPSVGAVLASLEGNDLDTGLNVHHVRAIDTYWAQLRLMYSPFEPYLFMLLFANLVALGSDSGTCFSSSKYLMSQEHESRSPGSLSIPLLS
jgi:pyruvate/oxaloacetate carboxyltransferase